MDSLTSNSYEIYRRKRTSLGAKLGTSGTRKFYKGQWYKIWKILTKKIKLILYHIFFLHIGNLNEEVTWWDVVKLAEKDLPKNYTHPQIYEWAFKNITCILKDGVEYMVELFLYKGTFFHKNHFFGQKSFFSTKNNFFG